MNGLKNATLTWETG